MHVFQSSPPEFGGRIRHRPAQRDAVRYVSILAPRVRGAHPGTSVEPSMRVLFQSSPPEFGGRIMRKAVMHSGVGMFQSSPPEFGGRIAGERRPVAIPISFNPRPPSSGGASARRLLH